MFRSVRRSLPAALIEFESGEWLESELELELNSMEKLCHNGEIWIDDWNFENERNEINK